MDHPKGATGLFAALSVMCLEGAAPAPAQDTPPEAAAKWSDVAEFSYVATSGNSETTTLGFKNALGRTWGQSAFELKAEGIRAETTTQHAVGPGAANFSLVDVSTLSAESYLLSGRYDHKIHERLFWYGSAGWDRNQFSGIQNRYVAAGGIGTVWKDTDQVKFRTDYAVSFTKQEDVVETPGKDDTFAGVRLSWKYEHRFGKVTTYTNDFIVDENLEQTSDLRGNMVNSVAVSMSAHLALKVSLQSLYDHEPAFRELDLENPLGTPTGTIVVVELDELDTIFTSSLVVNF